MSRVVPEDGSEPHRQTLTYLKDHVDPVFVRLMKKLVAAVRKTQKHGSIDNPTADCSAPFHDRNT